MSPGLRSLALALLAAHGAACAQTLFSLYTGSSSTRDGELHIRQPAIGTDATIGGVRWEARPFRPAPYYGLRLMRFFDDRPEWGVALDYTHYKVYAQTERNVSVSGTWQGAPVATTATMSQYVQRFEISHGVNLVSLNVIRRWPGSGERGLQPYLGAGIGHYLLHAESSVAGRSHETGYQGSGIGYQLLAGLHYGVSDRLGVFAETKFDRGTATVDIADGSARTRLHSLHLVAGLSYRF
jgi:opacity protein-like surface antigen